MQSDKNKIDSKTEVLTAAFKMVKESVLDQFVRLGGYDIVQRKEGKWKNITEASRKTGLSRPTIYRLLVEHPEPLHACMHDVLEAGLNEATCFI